MTPDRRTTGRTFLLLVRLTVAADPWRAAAAGLLAVAGQCWPLLAAAGVAAVVDAAGGQGSAARAVLAIASAVVLRLLASPPLATVSYSLRERTSARVERRIVGLVSALPGIEHLERPDLLNRIAVLNSSRQSIGYTVEGMLAAGATTVQLVVTALVLASVHPLLVLLPLAGLLPFAAGLVKNRLRAELDAESGHHWRAKKGMRLLAWAPEHGPDLRLAGAADTVRTRQDDAVRALRSAHDRWAIRGGLAQSLGDAGFGLAFVAVVVFVAHLVATGRATSGDLVVTLVLGQRLGRQIGVTIEQLTNALHAVRVLSVLVWLEDEAARPHGAVPDAGPVPPPDRFRGGIALRGVTFRYPGTEVEVLRDVDLDLPAGKRIALVGENGAGKTTLVSLLCGFHQPTSGVITVDGVPLARLDPRAWQQRTTAVFQEATRLEVELVESVGVGDLAADVAVASAPRVAVAVDRAGLAEVATRLPYGLDTRLGSRFEGGVDLSGGEWQKVAHARSSLRSDALLFVLDEPTAALDPEAERALFDRIRERPGAAGGVTLFVSHRFSTVRDADLIVVFEDGRLVEQGDHDQLVALGGVYAELYERQAHHYR